jgi:hypothetical protein
MALTFDEALLLVFHARLDQTLDASSQHKEEQ